MNKEQSSSSFLQSLLVILGCIGTIALSLYEVGLLGSFLSLLKQR